MNKLTIYIPIHQINDETSNLLDRAVESFVKCNNHAVSQGYPSANICFIGPSDVLRKIKQYNIETLKYVNSENSDFCSQVNNAAKNCETDYFSILELDDEYTESWFINFYIYNSSYPNVSVYLPLTELYVNNGDSNTIIGYKNEAVWATSFSEELGYIDLESLENYGDYNLTGGIFKVSDFIDEGGLKESMKLTFWYEFLMRMCYNSKQVFVIPKVGYNHYVNRKESLSSFYNENMKPDEAQWWIDLAHKEYFFKKDRNKTYDGE